MALVDGDLSLDRIEVATDGRAERRINKEAT